MRRARATEILLAHDRAAALHVGEARAFTHPLARARDPRAQTRVHALLVEGAAKKKSPRGET
jgi:hypothetical protein